MLRDLWTHVLKLFSGDDGRNKPAPAIATTKKTNVVIAPAAMTTDNGGDYAAPKKKRGLYRVKFYTGSYSRRQADANADGAICFVAHHFNAASKQDVIGHDPESGAPIYGFVHNPAPDYALCVVADNASAKSRAWAADYVERVSRSLAVRKWNTDGVCVGGMGGRGNEQIKYTVMPAILVEPLFASNPSHANIIRLASGRHSLATYLADSIRAAFPAGGLVAFSVGHKYKPAPHDHDRGAALHGGGNEADYAELVLQEAAKMLEGE